MARRERNVTSMGGGANNENANWTWLPWCQDYSSSVTLAIRAICKHRRDAEALLVEMPLENPNQDMHQTVAALDESPRQ